MCKNLIQLCFALLLGASTAWGQLSFEDISATAGVDSVGIARGISWPTLKPYFLTGATMTAILSALYFGFAWLALHGLVI